MMHDATPAAPILPSAAGTFPVAISNVAPGANEEALREFFSFAGPVGTIALHAEVSGGEQSGTVTFHTAAAAETAVLLDGALIVDRPLCIRPMADLSTAAPAAATAVDASAADHPATRTATSPAPAAASNATTVEAAPAPAALAAAPAATATAAMEHDGSAPPPPEAGWARDDPPPYQSDAERARAAISGLLDAGYTLGARALSFMRDVSREVEASTGIRQRASEALGEGAQIVRAFDETHQISASVRAFDEEHQVSRQAIHLLHGAVAGGRAAMETAVPLATSAAQAVREQAGALTERARDDPTVGPAIATGWETVAKGFASVSGWVGETWRR